MEGLFWVDFVSGKFEVSDKVEIDLAEVKDESDIFGGSLDPFLYFDSFFLVGFGKSLDAFALHLYVKSVFSVEEHVNKGIAKGKVIDIFEIELIVFGVVLEFGHVGSVGLGVEIGFREDLFGREFFSHIKECNN